MAAATAIYLAPICPFAHRAWMALELLQQPYTLLEVDLTAKSADFLAAYPKAVGAAQAPGAPAKVPVIRDAVFPEGLAESAVISGYLVDTAAAAAGESELATFMLHPTPAQRARAQIITEQIGGAMIKHFYALLSAQEAAAQEAASGELLGACAALGEAAAAAGGAGPFILGDRPSLCDVLVYPWPARFGALAHWRGFAVPREPAYARFHAWADAMAALPGVTRTLRSDAFYADGYASYATGAKKPA